MMIDVGSRCSLPIRAQLQIESSRIRRCASRRKTPATVMSQCSEYTHALALLIDTSIDMINRKLLKITRCIDDR